METLNNFDFILYVYDAFARSHYGQELAKRIRYARYKPGTMSNAEWVKLLGPDVDNLEHNLVTFKLAQEFLAYSIDMRGSFKVYPPLCYDELRILLLATIVHDFGEVKWGDISYDKKTKADEVRELKALRDLLQEIFNSSSAEITLADLDEAVEKVLNGADLKLSQIFNAIERVGYLLTAKRAWEQSKHVADPELRDSLRWLVHNVLSNQVSTLVAYAKIYPAVQNYKWCFRRFITEAFEEMPVSILERYPPDEIQKNANNYAKAREDWKLS